MSLVQILFLCTATYLIPQTCEDVAAYYQHAPLTEGGTGCCVHDGTIQQQSVGFMAPGTEGLYLSSFAPFLAQFAKAHPYVETHMHGVGMEAFKANDAAFLLQTRPVANVWVEPFVHTRQARIPYSDLTDVWQRRAWDTTVPVALRDSVTYAGKVVALPYDTYVWHMYYNTEVLSEAGLAVPRTWEDFKAMCTTLRDQHAGDEEWISPITMHNQYHFMGLAWLDMMFSRFAGAAVYAQLRSGQLAWTDSSTDAVWTELDFVREHLPPVNDASEFWQSHFDLSAKRAGAYFTGGFAQALFDQYFPNAPFEYADFPVETSTVQLSVTDSLMVQGGVTPAVENLLAFAMSTRFLSSNVHPNLPPETDHQRFTQQLLTRANATTAFTDRVVAAAIYQPAQVDVQSYFMRRIDADELRRRMDAHYGVSP